MLKKEKQISVNDIVKEMIAENVGTVLNICGNQTEFEYSQTIKKDFEKMGLNFLSATGFHPHEAEKFIDNSTDWIVKNSSGISAVGEVGLDFHYDFSPREMQRKMLRKMVEISLEVQKPLIIHGRNGEEEIAKILLDYGLRDKKIIFHCYTGTFETAMKIFENGWLISFSGIVTFNKSFDIQNILKNSPVDRIFFETDSPFLAPVPFRGKINTPGKVRYVYEFASELLQIEKSELASAVKNNFEKFFDFKIS